MQFPAIRRGLPAILVTLTTTLLFTSVSANTTTMLVAAVTEEAPVTQDLTAIKCIAPDNITKVQRFELKSIIEDLRTGAYPDLPDPVQIVNGGAQTLTKGSTIVRLGSPDRDSTPANIPQQAIAASMEVLERECCDLDITGITCPRIKALLNDTPIEILSIN